MRHLGEFNGFAIFAEGTSAVTLIVSETVLDANNDPAGYGASAFGAQRNKFLSGM